MATALSQATVLGSWAAAPGQHQPHAQGPACGAGAGEGSAF